jgi:hypothetical protein
VDGTRCSTQQELICNRGTTAWRAGGHTLGSGALQEQRARVVPSTAAPRGWSLRTSKFVLLKPEGKALGRRAAESSWDAASRQTATALRASAAVLAARRLAWPTLLYCKHTEQRGQRCCACGTESSVVSAAVLAARRAAWTTLRCYAARRAAWTTLRCYAARRAAWPALLCFVARGLVGKLHADGGRRARGGCVAVHGDAAHERGDARCRLRWTAMRAPTR